MRNIGAEFFPDLGIAKAHELDSRETIVRNPNGKFFFPSEQSNQMCGPHGPILMGIGYLEIILLGYSLIAAAGTCI